MFNFFHRNNEIIKTSISQTSRYSCQIDYISTSVDEKEIVLFLLMVYARMYRNCCMFFKDYKNDLNDGFKDIDKNTQFEQIQFEQTTEMLIKLYNISESKEKITKINLRKWTNHYSIHVGKLSTINPNMYFYCASLLLLDKIQNKETFLYCLIDIANSLSNRTISVAEGLSIPLNIVNKYYPTK
jgi:hypothetical protein